MIFNSILNDDDVHMASRVYRQKPSGRHTAGCVPNAYILY